MFPPKTYHLVVLGWWVAGCKVNYFIACQGLGKPLELTPHPHTHTHTHTLSLVLLVQMNFSVKDVLLGMRRIPHSATCALAQTNVLRTTERGTMATTGLSGEFHIYMDWIPKIHIKARHKCMSLTLALVGVEWSRNKWVSGADWPAKLRSSRRSERTHLKEEGGE